MPWAARTGTTGEVHLVDPYATAIVVVAQQFPGTTFTLDYADADGRPIALCLRALLLRAGWHQLSDVGPAPGFSRRGLILWTPSATLALVTALAQTLGELFAVQVVERHDGGPVAVTVGLATWSTARGVSPRVSSWLRSESDTP
ncbi:MAG TPA: hypothetical protein VIN74_09185 [Candidatus Limnocylindria bacterium]|jgi:hypothetical protein